LNLVKLTSEQRFRWALIFIKFFIKNDCRIHSNIDALFHYISPAAAIINNCVVKNGPLCPRANLSLHFTVSFRYF
jgi:hypothetical protein